MQLRSTILAVCFSLAAASPSRYLHRPAPTAETCNGTYAGLHSSTYNQDFFLGIPYAQPPVNDLRFRNPRSLDQSWKGHRKAEDYSPACVGYGPSQTGYAVAEDCLYLNVVRPAGVAAGSKLPRAVGFKVEHGSRALE
jgi:carboxylesterase type B